MSALRNNLKTPKKNTNKNLPNLRGTNKDGPTSPSAANAVLSPLRTPNTPNTHGRNKSVVNDYGKKDGGKMGPKPSAELEGYTQRQEDELEAIKSIYGGAVQLVEKKGAWNVSILVVEQLDPEWHLVGHVDTDGLVMLPSRRRPLLSLFTYKQTMI